MDMVLDSRFRITFFLWLVTAHSFAVGLGLILLPPSYLKYFGFVNCQAGFFQIQGGVFHLVMCVAYLMAARCVDRAPGLIYFAIAAKTIALIFLLTYYVFVESEWIVLVSGIGDGLMALFIWLFYRQYVRARQGI